MLGTALFEVCSLRSAHDFEIGCTRMTYYAQILFLSWKDFGSFSRATEEGINRMLASKRAADVSFWNLDSTHELTPA